MGISGLAIIHGATMTHGMSVGAIVCDVSGVAISHFCLGVAIIQYLLLSGMTILQSVLSSMTRQVGLHVGGEGG